MPRGGKRPGSGRKPKPLALHLLTGSFRPDRHGPRPSVLPAMPPATSDWKPSPEDFQALGPRAKALLLATLAELVLSESDGQRVMVALGSLTRHEALEAVVQQQGVVSGDGTPHPALAAMAREMRLFLSGWASLGFQAPEAATKPAPAYMGFEREA